MNRLVGLFRRVAASRLGRIALACIAIAAVVAIGLHVRRLTGPRAYFLSGVSFGMFRDAKVPKPEMEKLKLLEHRFMATPEGVLGLVREQVSPETFAKHQATFAASVRTRYGCGPNLSPRKVHQVGASRNHPLFESMAFERVIPQVQLPPVTTDFVFLPNNEGLLALGKFGVVKWFGADWKVKATIQLPEVYEAGGEDGALGITVDPDFTQNHFAYVAHVRIETDQSSVVRLTIKGTPGELLASRREVIRLPKDNEFDYHGIGALTFLPGRLLVIQVGDPTTHAQSWGDLQGKLIGVVPGAGPGGGYSLPPMSLAEKIGAYWTFGSPLILAGGLRMPFTGTRWRDRVIIGDVGGNGPNSYEKINVFSRRGQNFGWGDCRDPDLLDRFDPPTIAYRRTDPNLNVDNPRNPTNLSRSVIAGVVYENSVADRYGGALNQRLVYADFAQGFVRGAKLDDLGQVVDDVFLGYLLNITAMDLGPDGYVYASTAFGTEGLVRMVSRKR